MVNPKLHGLSQEKLSTSASGGHDKVTKPLARAVTARVAPAFLQPMIGARVKELLGCSGIFPPHAELTVQEATGDAILIQCSWLLRIILST